MASSPPWAQLSKLAWVRFRPALALRSQVLRGAVSSAAASGAARAALSSVQVRMRFIVVFDLRV
jgi:hypothetical protein